MAEEEWDRNTGSKPSWTQVHSLIIKQHVVMATANGESDDEKEKEDKRNEGDASGEKLYC